MTSPRRETVTLSEAAARTWLTAPEAAAYCRLGLRTFRARVKAGQYPPGHAVSTRRKVWSQADLDKAIAGTNREIPADPIMAAIHAAEKAASTYRADHGQGTGLLVCEDQGEAPRAADRRPVLA